MTAAFADSPATAGVRSLEVRWILPGQPEPAVAGWFGRFPAQTEYRQDSYLLLDPALGRLSVKVRAGRALEVKVYRGSPGILEVTGRARGHIQSWQKWSFPRPLRQGSDDPAGWRPVGKTRRVARFCLADGRAVPAVPGPAGEPGCAAELTEIHMAGQAWWSLGFEATGPAGLLGSALRATAALVFAHDMPGGTALATGHSKSYPEWLAAGADVAHA